MIPCSASCCVYRSFSSEGDWDLKPIPTLIGYVDPRRFSVFESGDGAMSANQYEHGSQSSMDSWRSDPGILHPPQHTYDKCMSRIFRVAIPERQHIEKAIEMENRSAQKSIRTEKRLAAGGWLPVKKR